MRKLDSGRVYAMKVMRKERILERDHGDYVRAERDVLTAVFHPYIVTLRFSFQARAAPLRLSLSLVPPLHRLAALLLPGARGSIAPLLARSARVHALGAWMCRECRV